VAVCCGLTLQVAAMQEQRRASAKRLREALKEAEQAARVKTEFLANMSHEIRTPLTSILGFASLLAGQDLDDDAHRYADRVLGASRSLLALVNDVLDFSKLEAGRLEIRPRTGSPEECGRDAVELFSPQAREKGLDLSFEAEGLPPYATADFDRVRQVLINLVGNAVKFTSAGAVRVSAVHAAGVLTCRVEDTGPGLDAEAQAKLFQRFSQVDASVSRAHGGSGLGLAISRGLVEAMGGRIGVESRPGEGARFWFEVPAPATEPQDEAGAASLDIAALAGLKLLLVDDNAANRELIRSLLTPLGVVLTTADGGQAAIDVARVQGFELILMDLRMPGVDGWTAARAIRGGDGPNRTTPTLAFSADIGVNDNAALALFEGVVRKPIEMMALLGAIAHWAERRVEAPERSPVHLTGDR
jgi:CheY-like chemotaxis protein/nitrogen-specific signal transduction histidine kinase